MAAFSVASLVVPRVHAYRDERAFLRALDGRAEAHRS
jgi:hypothetical protein